MRRPCLPGPRRSERGAVTAEAAAVLPVLLLVTFLMVWLVSVATAQVRVVDAAREAARQAARGEPDAVAVSHGAQVAPAGAAFTVSRSDRQVRVVAAAEVRGPGGLFAFLPGLTVEAETVAVREPE
ncbi:MAG TPA: TadE family type IV pilus minor pilin [Marmoricola sp.]|nr:TadE family type IV pilus minor pilin [Marmoricola sp.]